MNAKTTKILFYITTGLISLFYLIGVYMYLSGHENIVKSFSRLQFPAWLIFPLGIAKFLGVLAIWSPTIPKWLREWAYAGIFFNALLAFGANLAVGTTDTSAILVMAFLVASRYLLQQLSSGGSAVED